MMHLSSTCSNKTLLKIAVAQKGSRVNSHRAATTSQARQDQICTPLSRRKTLIAPLLGALTVVPILYWPTASASEVAGGTTVLPDAPPAAVPSKLYVDRDFSLQIPPGFKTEVSYSIDTNPVKARFLSPDGVEIVSVVTRNAAEVKLTFTQLSDISQYGDEKEVAKLVLPPGSRVEAFDSEKIEVPARDTGTIKGIVEIPPQTFYRYVVASPNGAKVALVVCAMKGRVFLVGGSAPAGRWAQASDRLQNAVKSFRLVV